jgi:hypothetical protein
MAFVHECLAVERDTQEELARSSNYQTWYIDGENDARFGRMPEYAHDAYLEGYVAQLKQLPTNEQGRLIHYHPSQHFAFGYIDGIGDRADGESNYEYDF